MPASNDAIIKRTENNIKRGLVTFCAILQHLVAVIISRDNTVPTIALLHFKRKKDSSKSRNKDMYNMLYFLSLSLILFTITGVQHTRLMAVTVGFSSSPVTRKYSDGLLAKPVACARTIIILHKDIIIRMFSIYCQIIVLVFNNVVRARQKNKELSK